jgi:hypothetical protein
MLRYMLTVIISARLFTHNERFRNRYGSLPVSLAGKSMQLHRSLKIIRAGLSFIESIILPVQGDHVQYSCSRQVAGFKPNPAPESQA